MNDHYQTLGVEPNASEAEIKKAYRGLAMKHHPDRGGDQAKFKEISSAYDTLSDQNKRAEYDQMRRGGPQVRFTSGGFQDINDMFGGNFDPFGSRSNPFADMFGRRGARNKDLNIQCQITLLDSYLGKQLEAAYRTPSGKNQTVVINVPPGISHGETIRYAGLGDDTISQIPRGNLNVTIIVQPDPNFTRIDDNLYTTVNITPIEAMIGCRKKVKLITGQEMDLDIRAGVESGTEFASGGNGFSNPHSGRKGKFVSVVKIQTPKVTDPEIIKKLKELNDAINPRS
jgi:curved DNA-binding protein